MPQGQAQAGMPAIGETRTAFGETRTWNGEEWMLAPEQPEEPGIVNRLGGVINQGMKDTAIGAAKGLGSTALDVSQIVPRLLKAVQGEEYREPANMRHLREDYLTPEPDNTMQSVGHGIERVAEVAVPMGGIGRGITSLGARMIPSAAPAGAMNVMNKIAALAGRVGGPGVTAAGQGMLHQDPNVDAEAAIASGAGAVGEGLSATVPAMLRNPLVQKVLPVAIAGASGGPLGFMAGGGLGAMLGAYGVKRTIADDIVQYLATKPGQEATRRTVRGAARVGGATGAALHSEREGSDKPTRRSMTRDREREAAR